MSLSKKSAAFLILAFAVAGCSLGLPYNQAKLTLPELGAGKSRVFIYRAANPLAIAFPRVVILDSKPFGDIFTGTTTYSDLAPGGHDFSIAGQKSKLTLQLRAGDVTYLRVFLDVNNEGIGDTIIKVTPKQTAEQDMHYTNMIEPKIRDLIKQ
jgi:hypothetical protein